MSQQFAQKPQLPQWMKKMDSLGDKLEKKLSIPTSQKFYLIIAAIVIFQIVSQILMSVAKERVGYWTAYSVLNSLSAALMTYLLLVSMNSATGKHSSTVVFGFIGFIIASQILAQILLNKWGTSPKMWIFMTVINAVALSMMVYLYMTQSFTSLKSIGFIVLSFALMYTNQFVLSFKPGNQETRTMWVVMSDLFLFFMLVSTGMDMIRG